MRVEFFRHNIGEEEKRLLNETLDSIFITTGKNVKQFEEALASYLKAGYCVAVTSCTEALLLAMKALDIGRGDEVITTPMTFVATSLAVIHAGAEPVWVDAEEKTGNINAELIETAITARTRAILPVHLYGQMCDMKKIRKIADRHGLAIIEDCAHGLESERDGIRAGELGDAACFSFYSTKSITSGEGGALTTHSEHIAERVRRMRLHGINKEAADRYTRRYEHWDLLEIGLKCNMSDIQAALLIPQLRRVELIWKRRKELFLKYVHALSSISDVSMPQTLPDSKNGYHLFTLWVDPLRRDHLLEKLQDMGIGVAVNYRPIHLLTAFNKRYGKKRGSYPIAEKIGDATISLPLYAKLTDDELSYVVESVKSLLGSGEKHS